MVTNYQPPARPAVPSSMAISACWEAFRRRRNDDGAGARSPGYFAMQRPAGVISPSPPMGTDGPAWFAIVLAGVEPSLAYFAGRRRRARSVPTMMLPVNAPASAAFLKSAAVNASPARVAPRSTRGSPLQIRYCLLYTSDAADE